MKDLLHKNREFWTHDRSIAALLIYLILSIFLWITFSGKNWVELVIRDIMFNLIILSGIFSVLTHWRQQFFFISLGIIALIVKIYTDVFPNENLLIINYTITLAFFVILVWLVLRHVFKDGPVNFYRILASIVIYMIVGIICALIYELIYLTNPSGFEFNSRQYTAEYEFSEFLYFSFVTLSTLGYGDVVPVASFARSLVVFQGMFGMLYPVIMIARLVSLEVEHQRGNQIKK